MIREDEVLATVRRVERAELTAWVEQGWIMPVRRQDGCYYSELDLARVRLIAEMRRDLDLDEGAIEVVLPLLDQVYDLRCQLRGFLDALAEETEGVRARIAQRLRDRREA